MRTHVHRFSLAAFLILLISPSWSSSAQGRPDLVWMAGGDAVGITSVAYSSDSGGKLIASCEGDVNAAYYHTVKVWRASDGALLRTFFDGQGFRSVAISPDTTLVAAGSSTGVIWIWNIATGTLVKTLTGFTGPVNSIAFSPDGSLLAGGSDDTTVQVWNLTNGSSFTLTGHTAPVLAVAFSPNGKTFASSCGVPYQNITNSLIVRRVSDWSQLFTATNPSRTLSFSPDGQTLALAFGYVWLFRVSDGAYLGDLPDGAFCATFSPDGKTIATGNNQSKINLWDWSSQTVRSVLTGHTATVRSVAYSADGQSLVSGGDDNTVRTWNVSTASAGRVLTQQTSSIAGMAVSPDGQMIASGSGGNEGLFIRRVRDGALLTIINATGSTNAIAFSPDGKYLAYSDASNNGWNITVLNVKDWSVYTVLKLPNNLPQGLGFQAISLAFSPNGQYLVAGLADVFIQGGSIKLWSVPTFTECALQGNLPTTAVYSVAFSSDGKTFASGGIDNTVRLWDASACSLIRTLPVFNGMVTDVAFSPDGQTLAVGSSESVNNVVDISLWNVATGQLTLGWQTSALSKGRASLAFSPDGQVLLSGRENNTLRYWLVSNGSLLHTDDQEINYWNGYSTPAVYTPDGSRILYGRLDGTVCAALSPFRNTPIPNHGGNTGNVTVTIITPSTFTLENNAQVALTASGQQSIVGVGTTVVNSHLMTTTFPLSGASLGVRDVVITNPDGSTFTQPQAFTIEQGVAPQIVTSIQGNPNLRAGPYRTYDVVVSNQGNVDASVADLRIEFPNWFNWQFGAYPVQSTFTGDDNTSISVQIPTIPAGGSIMAPIEFAIADVGQNGHRPFENQAWVNPDPSSKIAYIGDLTEPRVMLAEDANGNIVDCFGALDSTGTIASLSFAKVQAPNGNVTIMWFDSQSRLVKMQAPDGSTATWKWQSTSVIVTFISADGQTNVSVTVPITSSGGFGGHAAQSPTGCQMCTRLAVFLAIGSATIIGGTFAVIMATPGLNAAALFTLGALNANFALFATAGTVSFYRACAVHYCQPGQGITSGDPNDQEGLTGYGTPQWVSGVQPLQYTIFFSNDLNASAPAQQIVVTDPLDPINLDLTSVTLGTITIGNHQVSPILDTSPPVGSRQFDYPLDLRPDNNIIAHIHANLDLLLGQLTWTFTSIDPTTGLPTTDPLAGLLPAGVEGSVQVLVTPKHSVSTGTVVQNQATVVFDYNPPMNTPVWFNTLDNDKPISLVAPLPTKELLANFTVKWAGTDVGSGVKDFTMFVSDNGAAFTPWLTNTTLTKATFNGLPGHTYAFYSQARDNTYNVEPAHAQPDTSTTVHNLTLYHFNITPNPVPGSLNATGTIVMNGPTPSDTVVNLVNANPAVTVPATVTVLAGNSSQSFPIATSAVTAEVTGSVVATYNGAHVSKKLTVRPIGVQSVKLSANKIKGGKSVNATVTLEAAAAPGPITVSFTSSNPAVVPAPASITIPASSQTGTATISTNTVTANTSVVITATANGITKSAKLTVTP